MWTRLLDSFFPSSVATFRPELCLRGQSPLLRCTRCVDECPTAALELPERRPTLRASRCTGCGVCAAVCPVEAFAVQSSPLDLYAQSRALGRVHLSCDKVATSAETVRVPCIGYLDTSTLVAVAVAAPQGVWLNTSKCMGCSRRRGLSVSRRSADAAGRLLSAIGVSTSLFFQPDRPHWTGQPKTDMSRRDLFLRLAGRASTAAASAMSALDHDDSFTTGNAAKIVPLRRRLLLHALRELPSQEPDTVAAQGAPWAEPRIGATCSGCLLCVAFCPTAALVAHDSGTNLEIGLIASRCVACNACAEVCRAGAISFLPQLAVGHLKKQDERSLASFEKRGCPSCGEAFLALPNVTRCPRCEKNAELERDVAGWI